ncbi:MAG: hypothetical protein EHM33_00440 [Chloroflexi bacterium]|nr:MAG: hypothetical protein EHM33_00440 [Chloroflexota bacterium]
MLDAASFAAPDLVSPVELPSPEQTILRWRNDPVAFVEEVFGAADPVEIENWQKQALTAVVTEDRLSIRSGHGVGKSAFLAWTIIWFMATRYPVKVAATAPSAHQLYDVLWSEVRYWLRRAIPAVANQFIVKSDMIELVGGGSETFAVARTSRKENPDALQGFHSPHMLFIVDEASGVDDIIFEVAGGAMSTRSAKQILTGNPTNTKGYFARSQRPDSPFYKMKVSCHDSTRVDPKYIESMREEYGEDSSVFKVRVLGEFPSQDDEVLIPLFLVESAVNREVFTAWNEKPVWGLDVARYGQDRSCLVERYPRAILREPVIYKGLDTMELCGRVVKEYEDAPEPRKPTTIYVDVIGLGAGVFDRLAELNLPVVAVNVSESPAFTLDNVFRLRDELWMTALRWFESRQVCVINHTPLIGELTSVRKSYTSSGKMRLESKDDYKKRGNRSPDVADAFVLTFAYQSAVGAGISKSTLSNWKTPISRYVEGSAP